MLKNVEKFQNIMSKIVVYYQLIRFRSMANKRPIQKKTCELMSHLLRFEYTGLEKTNYKCNGIKKVFIFEQNYIYYIFITIIITIYLNKI